MLSGRKLMMFFLDVETIVPTPYIWIASSFQGNLDPLLRMGKLPLNFKVRFNTSFQQWSPECGSYVWCLNDVYVLPNLWHLQFSYCAVVFP